MTRLSCNSLLRTIIFTMSALALVSSVGCVGVVANLIHAAKGNKVPAEFDGLKDKRVAVICSSQTEAFGPSPISPLIASKVNALLERNVSKIRLVDQQEIEDWMDRNDWDGIEYLSIGKSVKADIVVAVDIDSFSLSDGKTMYKGRSDIAITVYDVASGDTIFARTPPQIQYPKNAVLHTADMSKRDFRRKFVAILAQRIARHFYPYDFQEDFALDTSLISTISF